MALPRYKITVKDNLAMPNKKKLGIDRIAYTADPAIMVKGVAFNNEKRLKFAVDKAKMRIAAPVLIPMAIYRLDDEGEYEVEFTEEVTDEIYGKFMETLDNTKQNFNDEHDNDKLAPSHIHEIWQVEDPEHDKSFTTYGIKVPKHSIFAVTQVHEEEYFNYLVENEKTGYSIEGFLGLELKQIIKTKQNTMAKEKVKSLLIDGELYAKFSDGTIEKEEVEKVEEVKAEDTPKDEETEKVEEVKEEDLADDEIAVTDEVTDKVEEVSDATELGYYSKEEVDAKFDEIYKMIGELKAKIGDEAVEEVKEEVVEEAFHSKFSKVINKK